MKRTWVRYALVLAWMVIIYRASATPDLKAVPWTQHALLEFVVRKSAHLFSFGLLALLVRYALAGSFARLGRVHLNLAAFAVTVLYAASDEWHQSFVPSRVGSPTDVMIDAAGAALALLLVGRRAHRGRSGQGEEGSWNGGSTSGASGSDSSEPFRS